MISKNLNTPIWQLTVGEFLELQQQMKAQEAKPAEVVWPEARYVYGLSGLASLFGCSKRAAANLKASGKIDKAIVQEGRKIVVDAALALELAGKRK